eukprot:3300479-Pleurochrysis_carterae.AAC.2
MVRQRTQTELRCDGAAADSGSEGVCLDARAVGPLASESSKPLHSRRGHASLPCSLCACTTRCAISRRSADARRTRQPRARKPSLRSRRSDESTTRTPVGAKWSETAPTHASGGMDCRSAQTGLIPVMVSAYGSSTTIDRWRALRMAGAKSATRSNKTTGSSHAGNAARSAS